MEIPSEYLKRIVFKAAERKASGLHMAKGSCPVMRLDGGLVPMDDEAALDSDLVNDVVGLLAGEGEVQKLIRERSVSLSKMIGDKQRVKVNIFYEKDSPTISIYIINNYLVDFDNLGLPNALKGVINSEYGLLVIAGPFGSGRTSTIASMVDIVNRNKRKHVIMLEDPIEYVFENIQAKIDQRQIGKDVPSALVGLENALREDIDIVVVGEFKEEFSLAMSQILNLASGNALVILELNAMNIVGAVEKLIEGLKYTHGQEAAQHGVADILLGVLAQRLLPRRGGGMALAYEFLLVNSAAKSMIREGRYFQLDNIIQTSLKDGMMSMEKSLENLKSQGLID